MHPIDIRILKDATGKSKGAAFVEFNDPKSAEAACKLDGCEAGPGRRKIRINPANGGGNRGGAGAGAGGGRRDQAN